jgi:hypothetical protein
MNLTNPHVFIHMFLMNKDAIDTAQHLLDKALLEHETLRSLILDQFDVPARYSKTPLRVHDGAWSVLKDAGYNWLTHGKRKDRCIAGYTFKDVDRYVYRVMLVEVNGCPGLAEELIVVHTDNEITELG